MKNNILKKNSIFGYVIASIFVVHFFISIFTGKWIFSDNPYNSYTLQSLAWLEGRLDLGRNYEYLELAQFGGNYYVSFPPFPSYIMLPFAIMFGEHTPDGLIAFIVCIFGAWYAYKIGLKLLKNEYEAAFWTLFIYIGSNVLFLTLDGWVWFFAQNLCFTLTFMTIYYAIENKPAKSFCCFAMSIGCRPFQLIYLPILIFVFAEKNNKKNIKRYIISILPACIIGITYMLLNYARFGSVWEFGHNYLPEFLEASNGQFSFQYMIENMKCLFRFPYFTEDLQIHFYEFNGTAFWLVSPIFLSFCLLMIQSLYRGENKEKAERCFLFLSVSCISLHILWFTTHKTMGGWHFGNRYTVDALPFVYLAICKVLHKKNCFSNSIHFWLCIFGIFVNTIGTIVFYLT